MPFLSERKPLLYPHSRLRGKKNKAASQLREQPAGQVAAARNPASFSPDAKQPLCYSAPSQYLVESAGGVLCDFPAPQKVTEVMAGEVGNLP